MWWLQYSPEEAVGQGVGRNITRFVESPVPGSECPGENHFSHGSDKERSPKETKDVVGVNSGYI